jgi:hypothetical protein
VRALPLCLAAVGIISCAPPSGKPIASGAFIDKADGFSITVPEHWAAMPVSRDGAYSGVTMQSPDYGTTHANCSITAAREEFAQTQESLNRVMSSGHMMRVSKSEARLGMVMRSGRAVPFANGILGFATEATLRVDHLIGRQRLFGAYSTTYRLESLEVMIPGHAYIASCSAEQTDFAGHREAFDRIIASFKLVASG